MFETKNTRLINSYVSNLEIVLIITFYYKSCEEPTFSGKDRSFATYYIFVERYTQRFEAEY